ncbi:MAG: FAD:protein FMN transferase, partial [Planctomycetaceae bacterium]|nr:FAD:protein FMN transferase [Planctomycetaceae bacterium]
MNDEQNLAINSNRHSLRSGVLHLLCGAIALLVLGDLLNAEEGLRRYEYLQIRMGIPVQITLYADREDVANRAADAAYDRFRELDRILSDYDPDSELMRFCAASAGTCVPLSPELMSVLTQARQFSQASDGAFDVTVGPVVKLWRVARRRKALPDEKALAAARELVDWQQVRLDAEQQTGALLRAGMRLDLGAIAKGYAADEALRVMKANGVAIALIDAGGDLTLGDPPPGRAAWSVVIEPLQPKATANGSAQPVPVTLHLKNCAVATSGDA